MSTAAELARFALAADLGAALEIPVGEPDDQPDPPALVIQPGDPYLEHAGTYGDEYVITVEGFVLVELASVKVANAALDAHLAALVHALPATGWWLASVGRPDFVETSGWVHYGLPFTAQTHLTL